MLVRLVVAVAVLAVVAPAARAADVLRAGVRLWVDPAGSAALAARSLSGRDRAVARRLARVPTATWLTGGTPAQVRARAAAVSRAAARERAVPVVVAYDVPGRDCSGYSSGGGRRASGRTRAGSTGWPGGWGSGPRW